MIALHAALLAALGVAADPTSAPQVAAFTALARAEAYEIAPWLAGHVAEDYARAIVGGFDGSVSPEQWATCDRLIEAALEELAEERAEVERDDADRDRQDRRDIAAGLRA